MPLLSRRPENRFRFRWMKKSSRNLFEMPNGANSLYVDADFALRCKRDERQITRVRYVELQSARRVHLCKNRFFILALRKCDFARL